MDMMLDSRYSTTKDAGTLKYFREKYNRRNVTPEKVTRSYEGSEKFTLSIGKVYLLEAALTFWGMEKLDDKPTQHAPPSGILHMTKEKKVEYFDEIVGEFVDNFAVANCEEQTKLTRTNEESSEPDRVRYVCTPTKIVFLHTQVSAKASISKAG
jgi:hypothetical protein